MSVGELIDLGTDPGELRGIRRRRFRSVVVPIAAAATLVVSVIGLLVAGYESNRRGALALSADVLEGLDKRIETQTALWLLPAQRTLWVLHDVLADGALATATRDDAERLAKHMLRNVESVSLVSLADTRGNYILQRRGADGGIESKTIDHDPGPRRVVWTRRAADDSVISTEEDPADSFDPRTRPWYIDAMASNGVIWTAPYIFFTDRVPGITAAVAFRRGDDVRAVFGVDVRLDKLSAFLATLEIGRSGRAIIVDREGRIVAHPDAASAVREEGGNLVRPRLDEFNDPVLLRAFSLLRVNGHGHYTFAVGGADHIAIWSRLRDVGDGTWSMLITVPEKEFVGFVGTTSRITGAVGALVVFVALALAALLIRQGLRADRMERTIERRSQFMVVQARALASLVRADAVHDPSADEGLGLLTAALADTLQARRASLWRMGSARDSLRCEGSHDPLATAQISGLRLRRADHPGFFAALERGKLFEVGEAATAAETASLKEPLLAQAGTHRLMAVPAMRGNALIGALLVEDRDAAHVPQTQAFGFALAVAGIAVARLTAAEHARRAADGAAPPPARRIAPGGAAAIAALPPPPARQGQGDGALAPQLAREPAEKLSLRQLDERGLAAEVFPAVTVMVLRFSDALALAEPVAQAGGHPLVDQVVRIIQQAAEAAGVGYLRVMGDEVVVADGFNDRTDAAPEAITALALDVAERSAHLFASLDLALAFRIGIDTGMVIGSPVGQGTRTYNIWGEAMRAAATMARSAPPGSIQLTEATHARIAGRFTFRPRGRFWVPGQGEAATYLIAGRA